MAARAETKVAPSQRLTLKEMVRGANTTPRAVRFYEAQNLIRAAARSPGGHRWFHRSELARLRLVIDLRECGLSIEEIRAVLSAKNQGTTPQESALAVQKLLSTHLHDLQRKVAILERLGREFTSALQILDQCVHCEDPRGMDACSSCELPRLSTTPASFHQIWTLPTMPETAAAPVADKTHSRGKPGA
ncbi:MAG: MerR family transcriptional regulator [Myxococcales bacterium]|nr:MerR family transcriptional regulator [Myxococcales bacterium]